MRTLFSKVVGTDGNEIINYVEVAGLSTDSKPTNVATGSLFFEVDTGTLSAFDEDSGDWVSQFSFSGGDGE